MGTKSTIFRVHSQTFNKGFTLLELIVSMTIFMIVGGLALNSFVESSKSFSDDKKNIESNQNLSAALGIIGNDIKQAGELINDNRFPVVVIAPNADSGSMNNSSKITIRRALVPALTLCEDLTASTAPTTPTTLVVADDSKTQTSCKTPTTSLSTTTLPASIVRPNALRQARNYRCKLDDINANYTTVNTDFCNGASSEKVRAIMSVAGNIWQFDYISDEVVTANTKFNIGINNPSPAITPKVYPIETPIYLIEERIYSLDDKGDLKLQRDGGTPETLLSGISTFNVSARVYSDTTTKEIEPNPTNGCTVAQDPDTPTSPTADNPKYACSINPVDATYNWKTLAGIKVRLQARYDPSGGTNYTTAQLTAPDTTAPAEIRKLRAAAEFFPRNVLSR